ncbi:TnsA endonuclease N-terminal domain-containing protein [Citrobacter sp. RHBSTW-00089]|uniref:TnsA endonuclease N-terminal domain-containing protein n=1 Tax=Citrobacter sp. RHBSTW-00089 TaxID=2742633 RepID=UPI002221FCD8|nr:TnsA endonuclease N-terminal domain-containing protein [Citrobacter freundii]
MNSFLHQASFATGYWYYDRHRSVRLVILVGLAIDQIAQSGLSSLSVIYYSAQLFSDTRQIAIDSGIKHPVIRGVDQVMSTDFLVDCKDGPFEQFAIQVKPAAALQDERTLEKLELERRYWQQKQIPWFIFTDKEINPVVKENIEWLYSVKTEEVSAELLAQLSPLAHILQEKGDENIINVCKQVDIAYDLELGKTLSEIRALTANGFIKFNIYKSFRANKCADLCISQVVNMEELRYVAN